MVELRSKIRDQFSVLRKEGRGRKEERKEGGRFCLCPTNGQTELKSPQHKEIAISSPAWEVKTMSVISRSSCGQFVGAIDGV